MTRTRTRFVLLGLILSLAASLSAARQDLAAIDRFVEKEMARQQIPGVAVAVIRKGETVIAKGYGIANVEHNVPVTRETISD